MSAGADRPPHHHHHHHGPGAHHHSAPVFWPKEATLLLIELFKQNEGRFTSGLVRKKLIWKEIAEHVQRSGHAFTWEQCEGRWKTLTAAYRRALLHNRCSQFHKELHEVLGYGPTTTTNCHDQLQAQPRPIAPKPPSQQPQQQQQQHPAPPTAPSASNPAGALGLSGAPSANGSCVQGSLALSADSEANPPSSRMSGKSMMQPRFKKRRTPNSDILDWMAEFEDRQERRSREFLEKMERMHCEKISVITELIGVMKELIK